MLNYTDKFNFPIKLLKTAFVSHDKWLEVPGFDIQFYLLVCSCTV